MRNESQLNVKVESFTCDENGVDDKFDYIPGRTSRHIEWKALGDLDFENFLNEINFDGSDSDNDDYKRECAPPEFDTEMIAPTYDEKSVDVNHKHETISQPLNKSPQSDEKESELICNEVDTLSVSDDTESMDEITSGDIVVDMTDTEPMNKLFKQIINDNLKYPVMNEILKAIINNSSMLEIIKNSYLINCDRHTQALINHSAAQIFKFGKIATSWQCNDEDRLKIYNLANEYLNGNWCEIALRTMHFSEQLSSSPSL